MRDVGRAYADPLKEHYLRVAAVLQRQLDTARELCDVATADGENEVGTLTKRLSRDGNNKDDEDEDEDNEDDDNAVSDESKGDRPEGCLMRAREAMLQSYLFRLTGGMFVGQGQGQGDGVPDRDRSRDDAHRNGSADTGSGLVSCMSIVAYAQAAWWCELVRAGRLAAASVLMSRHLAFMAPHSAGASTSMGCLSLDRVATSLCAVPDTTPIGHIIPHTL